MIYKNIAWITFLNEPGFFLCTKVKGFKYCYIQVKS